VSGRGLVPGTTDEPSPDGGNDGAETADGPDGGPAPRRGRVRRTFGVLFDLTAGLVLMIALLTPDLLARTRPADFLRIPVEGLLLFAALVVLPRRPGRILAVLAAIGLGVLNLDKVLDTGFHFAFTRPFDLVADWSFLGDGLDFLSTSVGSGAAFGAVAALVVFIPLGFAVLIASVLRTSRVVLRNRRVSAVVVAAISLVWVVSAVTNVQIFPHRPIAARSALSLVDQRRITIQASLKDQGVMAAEASVDRFKGVPAAQLLTGLRGKNVLLVFVESYGRSAVEDPRMAPQIDPLLDAGTQKLAAAGFSTRSGWLTSPTYGGGSWFAHSTLLSGLWVNTQGRYMQLTTATQRFTLNKAFHEAGWRTVGVEPAIRKAWPEGHFYGYDKVYNFANLGYKGPRFGYAPMTDQYILANFRRTELVNASKPVMGEIVLVSSHTPWAPLPGMVDWDEVGDGSVFLPMPGKGQDRAAAWQNPETVRKAYVESVQYTLNSLITYVQTYADPNTVLVVLGDHQPASVVTTNKFGRDVPITVIAHDPKVLDRISGWNWTPGLRPAPQAPVWPMSDFRDRFLTAFGAQQPGAPATGASPAPSTPAPSASASALPVKTGSAQPARREQ
jgi:hypothetical protein